MDKVLLRDTLFKKYFQIENGISVKELNEKLSFIPKTWNKLHTLCEKSIRRFDSFSTLEKFKLIEHNNKKYLILKLRIWKYVIIDVDEMRNISREEFEKLFDEQFFIDNFDERSEGELLHDFYQVVKYQGDIQELLNFYFDNENIFNMPNQIHCKMNENEAWTYLFIDLANASVQMGFQTPDQTLYEQLFLNYDLTPYGMQDAVNKMGKEKIEELFSKMKDIEIPIDCIPQELLEYLVSNNIQLKKKN